MIHWTRRQILAAGVAVLPRIGRADAQETTVFAAGKDGYHTYRIPSLLAISGGTLLAFVEGRRDSAADHGDVDLLLKRSTDGGGTWSPQMLVYEEGGTAKITIGNPCPVWDQRTKTVWLPFCRENNRVFVTKSRDGGLTWSAPGEITKDVSKPDWGWYATGPGVGIQIQKGRRRGRLVIPCDHAIMREGVRISYSHVIFSDDHGQTWQLGGSVGEHTNECQVAELPNGVLQLNMRNRLGRYGGKPDVDGYRLIAESRDDGLTWESQRVDSVLIEPMCQASLIRHPRRGWLLFSNPADKKQRVAMTVRISKDGGRTWPVSKLIHAGPSAYSCLAVLRDGTVGLLYEGGRVNRYEEIRFRRFPLDWLERPA